MTVPNECPSIILCGFALLDIKNPQQLTKLTNHPKQQSNSLYKTSHLLLNKKSLHDESTKYAQSWPTPAKQWKSSALWTCITCRLKDTSTRATHESVSVTWSNLRMHGSYVCCLVMPWSIQVMQGNVHKFRTKHVALQRNFHPNANHCRAMPIPTRLFASIWAPSCTRKA